MTSTTQPQRLQQSRRKGADIRRDGLALNGLQTVSVARPAKWRNPFTVEEHGRRKAIRLFCEYVADKHAEIRRDLRGKNLACYCEPGAACHADVLLEIANTADALGL